MKRRVVSLLIALVFALTCFGAYASGEETKPYGTLHMYTTAEITNLNPHENMDADAEDLVKGTLLKPYAEVPTEDGSTSHYVPELAAELPIPQNDEQTEWIIPIRQGLTWENGDKITAHDFVYSMKMALDPKLLTSRGASVAADYITIVNAEKYMSQASSGETVDFSEVGIQEVDEYTVKIICETYAEQIDVIRQLGRKWATIVNEKLYEACMSEDRTSCSYGTSLDKWMSCGAFILTDFQPGVSYTMKRNENYVFPDLIKIEAYNMVVVKDANTALELFLNGELDQVSLSAAAKEQYEDDPRILEAPASTVNTISINRLNPDHNGLLGNLNFRKAMFYGATIANMVKGIPANYILGQKVLGNIETGEKFRDLEGTKAYIEENNSYDPVLAKEYYDKAMAEVGLTEVTLEIIYNESSANYRTTAEYLEQSLPKIFGEGFSIKLNPMEKNLAKTQRKLWQKGVLNCFDFSIGSWDTSSLAPWNAMKVYCAWYKNRTDPIFDDTYDALWEEANNTRKAKEDLAYRLDLVFQMEKIALDDVFVVPLYEVPSFSLVSERVNLPFDHYVPGYGRGYMYSSITEGN